MVPEEPKTGNYAMCMMAENNSITKQVEYVMSISNFFF